MIRKFLFVSLLSFTLFSCASSENSEEIKKIDSSTPTSMVADNDGGVFFQNLTDGDKVKSPVIIDMAVKGMEVEPAGELHDGKGHHHLIIDGTFEEKGTMVPKDETHIHYGGGETKDTIDLTPGKHSLTLQFANGMHQSYGEPWSKTISIEVEK